MRPAVVTVFGSSSPRPGDELYAQAESLGQGLARQGFAVATGGYVGTMEAVSKGAAEAGGWVVGVTCERIERWRAVTANRWVGERIHCDTLRERAFQLVEVSQAMIALPGGLGTLSEITLALSWMQTGEVAPRPLWTVGAMWRSLLREFFAQGRDFTRPEDQGLVQYASDIAEVLEAVRQGRRDVRPHERSGHG
jgi:uncharacterized protein (TIGR00730 family)